MFSVRATRLSNAGQKACDSNSFGECVSQTVGTSTHFMLVQGDRLTEKIFSSICLVVGIFWEVVNLLTHTFKCPCSRRKTLLETVSEELLPWLNKHISLITILVDHYVWHSINKINAVIPFVIFYVWQTLLKSLLVPITSPHKHNTHIHNLTKGLAWYLHVATCLFEMCLYLCHWTV